MNTDTFWNIVEDCTWSGDYLRIKKHLLTTLTREEGAALRETLDTFQSNLSRSVVIYERESGKRVGLGDDGYSDLLYHIIGLGREEYERHFNDVSLVFDRANQNDFVESFSYAIPYKEDYQRTLKD